MIDYIRALRDRMYNHIALLIGHLIGDYVLQNDWMACRKTQRNFAGAVACDIHSFVYAVSVTFCVILSGWEVTVLPGFEAITSPTAALLIAYVTHYPIDRLSLGAVWGKLIRQTKLMDQVYVHTEPKNPEWGSAVELRTVRGLYAPIVQIAVDNTMHLFLMWILFSVCGEIVS